MGGRWIEGLIAQAVERNGECPRLYELRRIIAISRRYNKHP
jgi:hypothetical protein